MPPRALKYAVRGTLSKRGSCRISSGVTTACVRQPCRWNTISPSASRGVREAMTRPMVRPSSGAPSTKPPGTSSIISRW